MITADDMKCKCGCGDNVVNDRFIEMINAAELLAPTVEFTVNSGYRCLKHNEEVGGVESSAHRTGEAADLRSTFSGDRYKIREALHAAGFCRFGHGKTFLHVDSSQTLPQDREWTY